MKKFLSIIFVAAMLFACKNKTKTQVKPNDDNIGRENIADESTTSLYDLVDFKGHREIYKVNKELFKGIFVEEIAFIDESSERFICIIKLNGSTRKEDISLYRIGLRFFPFEEDRIHISNKYARETGKPYDPNDFNPKLKHIEKYSYLVKSVYSELRFFEKLEIFLFDKDGYKGTKGNVILLDQVAI